MVRNDQHCLANCDEMIIETQKRKKKKEKKDTRRTEGECHVMNVSIVDERLEILDRTKNEGN